jgi:hypothetical protein
MIAGLAEVPRSVNNSLTTRTRQAFNWLPIFEESLRDVLEWHWNSGIRKRPLLTVCT